MTGRKYQHMKIHVCFEVIQSNSTIAQQPWSAPLAFTLAFALLFTSTIIVSPEVTASSWPVRLDLQWGDLGHGPETETHTHTHTPYAVVKSAYSGQGILLCRVN